MTWNSWSEFFAMGGYGLYVWGAYAAVAVWVLVEPWLVHRQHRVAANNIFHDRQQEIKDETTP